MIRSNTKQQHRLLKAKVYKEQAREAEALTHSVSDPQSKEILSRVIRNYEELSAIWQRLAQATD